MITKQAIYDEIVKVLRQELLIEGELDLETSVKALGLDSMQLMQLFVYLEESFDFEFAEGSLLERLKDAPLSQFVDCVDSSLRHAR